MLSLYRGFTVPVYDEKGISTRHASYVIVMCKITEYLRLKTEIEYWQGYYEIYG